MKFRPTSVLTAAIINQTQGAIVTGVHAKAYIDPLSSISNRTELVQAVKQQMVAHAANQMVAEQSHLIKEQQTDGVTVGVPFEFKALVMSEAVLDALLQQAYNLGKK